jgi:hypothetical protein
MLKAKFLQKLWMIGAQNLFAEGAIVTILDRILLAWTRDFVSDK